MGGTSRDQSWEQELTPSAENHDAAVEAQRDTRRISKKWKNVGIEKELEKYTWRFEGERLDARRLELKGRAQSQRQSQDGGQPRAKAKVQKQI